MPIRPSLKMLPLALGGLVTTVIMVLVLLFVLRAWWSTPIFGFGAGGPDQPIAFPHDVHVKDHGIRCEFCHRNVTKGDAATVPAVEQCLFCHKTITGTDEQAIREIGKLLAAGGIHVDLLEIKDKQLKDELGTPVPYPIDWERVHRLPDHVQFVHESHIRFFTTAKETVKGKEVGRPDAIRMANEMGLALSDPPQPHELIEATCAICHGEIREKEKVKQERRLKMGDCVDCHRDNNAPTDCTTCHY